MCFRQSLNQKELVEIMRESLQNDHWSACLRGLDHWPTDLKFQVVRLAITMIDMLDNVCCLFPPSP